MVSNLLISVHSTRLEHVHMVSVAKLYTMEAAVVNYIQNAVIDLLGTESMLVMAVERATSVPVSTQSIANPLYLTKPVTKRSAL